MSSKPVTRVSFSLKEGDLIYCPVQQHFMIVELVGKYWVIGKMITHNPNHGELIKLAGFDDKTYTGSEIRVDIKTVEQVNFKYNIFN